MAPSRARIGGRRVRIARQAMREEQERVAAFYEAQARRREERENAEAASVAEPRLSGA